MPDLNIFKIDFHNLAKLSREGKIVKVYRAMYNEADRLAIHEMKSFLAELATTKPETSAIKGIEMITNFKKERMAFHMDEMKKLLEISLKEQSKQK